MIEKYSWVIKYALASIVFLVVIFLGHCSIKGLMVQLHIKNPYGIKPNENEKEYALMQSGVLGIFERPFFLACFFEGWFIVIGFWLTLKSIVLWKKWEEKNGRVFFNNFLIGNCINLIYSVFGFFALHFLKPIDSFKQINVNQIIIFIFLLFFPYIVTWIVREIFINHIENIKSQSTNHDNTGVFYKETVLFMTQNTQATETEKETTTIGKGPKS